MGIKAVREVFLEVWRLLEAQYTFPLRGFEVIIVRSDSLSYGLKLFLCQSLANGTKSVG